MTYDPWPTPGSTTEPSYQVSTGWPWYCCSSRLMARVPARGDSQTGCPSPSTISRACCESPPAGVMNTSPGAAFSGVVVTVRFGGVRSGRVTKCRRSFSGLFLDAGFGAGGGRSGNGDGWATVNEYDPPVAPRTASGVVTVTCSPGENGWSGT